MPGEAMAARGQIGLVSHQPLLYPNLTARENLKFFARLYDIPADESGERIDDLLRRTGLHRRGDSLAGGFSRGMRQRLGIARALLHQPDILLLDEPYTGLDQRAATLLDALICDARDAGKTIILSTHQMWRAAGIASRGLILSSGRLAWDGDIAPMSASDLNELYRRAVGMPAA